MKWATRGTAAERHVSMMHWRLDEMAGHRRHFSISN